MTDQLKNTLIQEIVNCKDLTLLDLIYKLLMAENKRR